MLPNTGPDSLTILDGSDQLAPLTMRGTVAGVVMVRVSGECEPGEGRLKLSEDKLSWREPGASGFGRSVAVTADGSYILPGEDESAFAEVAYYATYAIDGESIVTLTDRFGQVGDDQDIPAAVDTEDVTTWTLRNDSTTGLSHITAWVDEDATGISISLDNVTFTAPTTEATGLTIGDLRPAATASLYIQQTTAPTDDPAGDLLNLVHISFEGL